MIQPVVKKSLVFIGLSNVVENTIKEHLSEFGFEYKDYDRMELESLDDFKGILIADLTQFENSFERVAAIVKKIENKVKLYFIHSYTSLPQTDFTQKYEWVQSDKIVEELIPKLIEN